MSRVVVFRGHRFLLDRHFGTEVPLDEIDEKNPDILLCATNERETVILEGEIEQPFSLSSRLVAVKIGDSKPILTSSSRSRYDHDLWRTANWLYRVPIPLRRAFRECVANKGLIPTRVTELVIKMAFDQGSDELYDSVKWTEVKRWTPEAFVARLPNESAMERGSRLEAMVFRDIKRMIDHPTTDGAAPSAATEGILDTVTEVLTPSNEKTVSINCLIKIEKSVTLGSHKVGGRVDMIALAENSGPVVVCEIKSKQLDEDVLVDQLTTLQVMLYGMIYPTSVLVVADLLKGVTYQAEFTSQQRSRTQMLVDAAFDG